VHSGDPLDAAFLHGKATRAVTGRSTFTGKML
jgi:hypothetical protein